MSAKLVLIDTSAWIEYLKKTSHPITKEIESALLLNVAATCQLVLAELIQGVRSEKETELISDLASVVKILNESDSTWQQAGFLANKLRKQGKTISLIDCYLAVLAKENKAVILTLDKHFAIIDELFK
ncbi:MAG: PIN domain-containing protein [Candidatus Omnitrophota bacterium]|nr:PIN domain-containing protein [Candidatus Omnitrophota bacterium]